MAVSESGNVCSDAAGISTADLMAASSSGLRIGVVDLARTQIRISAGLLNFDSRADIATSLFGRFSTQQLAASRGLTQLPSLGSCAVSVFRGLNPSPVDPIRPTPFNAGDSLSVAGPLGSKTVPRAAPGVYTATLGGAALDQLLSGGGAPEYLVAGDYTISAAGGPGGDDSVGRFDVRLTIPAAVNWTNADQITVINRSQDLEITWTGGNPNGFVSVSAVGIAAGPAGPASDSPGAAALCLERASAGRVRIPSFVLQALPPSVSGPLPSGFLLVGATGAPVRFSAPNLDAGYATFRTLSGKSLTVR
jgi:hypothetical protein